MASDGNQDSMTEVEAEERQLNYVEILLLGDVGEAVIAIFFTRVINIMRITGRVDTGKMGIQNIPLLMLLGTTHQELEDPLRIVLIL